MKLKIGVVMDPIEHINPHKDSTLAMLLAARRRGWETWVIEPDGLSFRDGRVMARCSRVEVRDDPDDWFTREAPVERPLTDLPIVLMRKDPPFDMEYIYATYLLELAETAGTLVVNKPASLRDANEKAFTLQFPQCTPATLVSRRAEDYRAFLQQHKTIIVKPLDGMGGASIFRISEGDPNTNVILETLLEGGTRTAMAQQFLPEYIEGDKRILLIDGKPVDYALARLPAAGEGRANLAAGGSYKGVELTERDRWICQQVGPELKKRGLIFTGIDVIGDYLTEINVTSPTCIRELDRLYGLDIAADLMDCLAQKIQSSTSDT